jgi:hypothetical protein
MTIGAVWVRSLAGSGGDQPQELLFCTDSRVNGGMRFDSCPKILPLARGDAGIAFAGSVAFSYPMMLQMANAIESHRPLRTRAMNISKLRGHVLKVLDEMQRSIHTFADDENIPKLTLMLGGYHWIHKKFEYWRVAWSDSENRFVAHRPILRHRRMVTFFGDEEWILEANQRLKGLLQVRHGLDMPGETLDMEPFEIIRDLLRESVPAHSIGGAPQVLKIYQYLNSQPMGVFWPQKDGGKVSLLGRTLLPYERTDAWILDPDTLVSEDGAFIRASDPQAIGAQADALDDNE